VDYLNKNLWLDVPWPARSTETVLEIGVPGHMTSYTTKEISADAGPTRITLTQGADYYRSPIEQIDEQAGTVTCTLPITMGLRPGIQNNWVASDDAMTTFWRADYLERGVFKLNGPPLNKESFAKPNALRLWEYGVGDSVRQSTGVSLRRLESGDYELSADVDVVLSLRGKAIQISIDGKTWQNAKTDTDGQWLNLPLAAPQASDAPVRIKILN
jgi:hypothetical protein